MINVTKTYLPDIDKYKDYVNKIYDSGWITNNGELVRELEKRLEKYLGIGNLILVSNGTLALQVAYKVLGISGDVITTPFSFVATTSSLVWEGLRPRYVDIDERTLNIDVDKIEEKISQDTSCIVPTHVFGNGCDVDRIKYIAEKNNLKVIYDAAHCFGVNYNGESILNYGDISILSFHATKIFHTIEGGALIINNDEIAEKVRKMINFGFASHEKITELGINAKMNEFQAAMGLCLLDDIGNIMDNRKKIYEYYLKCFNGNYSVKFQCINKKCTMNYSYFPIIFKSEYDLFKIRDKLLDNNVIPRRYFYPSLNKLPYVQDADVQKSNSISKRILCLPIYYSLDVQNQDIIIRIIEENLKQ
ncbi:DegT/DnrJ/EryC1/StrS family aminotransferase [Vallitalea guaymasensis]|uniref:DegT/DnrJ/EryC1/StrS family aminotransferase n=1 Tax=Vallitalea guaymasensis TaxID=1185412 RepID=A0A8J8MC37_9FIRM|nr:DegT/DnrJ/EryC1/StrS family aminotransferase [Vallitalea guaymasensis]QUH30227.1 DegT/DnrJ/EryC1/StrS family aminotransferase [Vallitalea guaymasensis]